MYTIVHAFRPKNGTVRKGNYNVHVPTDVFFGSECFVAAVCVGAVMTLDLSDLYRLHSKNRLTVMFNNDSPLQFIADS